MADTDDTGAGRRGAEPHGIAGGASPPGAPAWPSEDADTTGKQQRPPQRPQQPPQHSPQQPPQRLAPAEEQRTAFLRQPPQPPQPPPPPPLPRPPQVDAEVTQEIPVQHAAPAQPMRVQPGGARRKRGLLITSALALVVLIAAGVVLALPAVANRMGLPWAPNLPKGDAPQPVAVSRDLHGPEDSAATPTADGLAAALQGPAGAAALGSLTGTVVDPATGTALWEQNADRARTPASTTKLLTAAAALLGLDHGSRVPTKIVEGDTPGSVVLVAGGDVTLSSLPPGQESFYPGAAHLDDLVAQVKKATGGNVSQVQLDLSAFEGNTSAAGWAPEDVPSTYGVSVVPAMLDGGSTSPTDFKAMRVANPAGVLVNEVANRLGASVGSPSTATAAEGAEVLGEVRSAPMVELVDVMLRSSDNLLADVIARYVAIAEGEAPTFEGGARATLKVLARNGFEIRDVRLSDGSGLSTKNKVPANVLSDILGAAAAEDANERTTKLRPLLAGLPVAGGTGTLADRYTEPSSADARGWARAKTGTLDGVNTLAGIVLDADGRVLVFALMASGAQNDPARAALDDIVGVLRACGCR